MSQNNGKLIDEKSMKRFNLKVLKQIDPNIEEILVTADHVTFYEFNPNLIQWSRKDVEGTFFVVKTSTQPRFQFIVMNRRSSDNLVENLLGDFEYEVQGPYLLYRNASQEMNGIWFYSKPQCDEVASVFNRIRNAYSKVNQKPEIPSSKSEFEGLEALPTMAVMDGPLEPSSTARDPPDDPAFINFYCSAMALGNTTSGSANGPPSPYQSSAIPHQPHQPTIAPPVMEATPPPLASSSPLPLFDNNSDFIRSNSYVPTDLVTPSSFFSPPGPSLPTAPPLNPNNATHQQQWPYGIPVLQPFPPPTPPPSLAPAPHTGSIISRDKVKEALLALVQDNEFIDKVTRALQKAHQP